MASTRQRPRAKMSRSRSAKAAPPKAPPPAPSKLGQPGWVLLPQRLFLGVTFCYAGLQKLSDPHYFATADPRSVHAQMEVFRHTSPIGPLVGIAAAHSTAAGLLIALAEIAVGLGTLFGLFTQLAAAGGVALSLTFLLTASWHTHPYFLGSDIVFIFLWIPIIAVGSAGVLSLDGWLPGTRSGDPALDRRTVLQRLSAVGSLAALGLLSAFVARLIGGGTAKPTAPRATGSSGSSPGSTGSSGSSGAPTLVTAARVPVGGAVLVTDPATSQPVTVLQPTRGSFRALSAVCPHAGCMVSYLNAQQGFVCPCHGSTFDANGQVTQGPASQPLLSVAVRVVAGNVVRG